MDHPFHSLILRDLTFAQLRAASIAKKFDVNLDLPEIDSATIEELVKLSDKWGIATDLQYHLRNLDLYSLLSQESKILLEVRNLQARTYEHALLDQLRIVCGALDAAGVTYTLLKGTALIAGGYTLFKGHRRHHDIDLLVAHNQLDQAYDALNEKGFVARLNMKRPISDYWHSTHLPPLDHPDYKYRVEIHHIPLGSTVWYSSPYTTGEILNARRSVNYEGVNVSIPCVEFQLFSTVYHSEIDDACAIASINHYKSMIDVSLILQKSNNNFNWPELFAKVKAGHIEKVFKRFLYYSAHCADSSLPSVEGFPALKDERALLRYVNERWPAYGQFYLNNVTRFRDRIQIYSKGGRLERRSLRELNPDDWIIKPITWKIKMRLKQFLGLNI